MRKRAQRKSKTYKEEPKHIAKKVKTKTEIETPKTQRSWWIAISLVAIFLLVLFFNSYFNITSDVAYNPDGEGFEKYYLSGPDPYYNMRLVEGTYETGVYPYYSSEDPLLNYPIGARGGRAPLLNMMAIGFGKLMSPFMDEIDAIGYSMQFIPALFGALLVFPVYFIGKELFNKKSGLIAAMFIALIPIHISSGHGSAYSLFDHDSFNLLLFFLTFLFLIKSIKEKDSKKSMLYALLGGVPLAALTMTWVEAQFLYVIIAIYAVVQMIFDIFTNKIDIKFVRTSSLILLSGYIISLPVIYSRVGFKLDIPLFLFLGVSIFGLIYYLLDRKKIPWTISLPFLFGSGAIALVFIYLVKDLSKSFNILSPLTKLSTTLFGQGIYGNKVSMTIAEANTYQISQTVMSFGPSIYWLAWAGFVFLAYKYYKDKQRKDYLFILVLFIVNIWLAGTAGRFLNDSVPLIAILGAWIVWVFIDWLDYKQMIRNIKSAGGGFHGLRRGIKFLHIFGILFLAVLVIIPSAFITLDAAVPNMGMKDEEGNYTKYYKEAMFGEDHGSGAFGLSVGKERYWVDAFNWLSKQDTEISNPNERPAFISWWDYGFYEVAVGDHPTVADNFQDGIPVAANFHTSTGEKEAVVVLSVRLLEGYYKNYRTFSDEIIQTLYKHLGEETADDVIYWIKNPRESPSYGDPIGEEYDKNTSKDYTVGQQYADNAVYHDVVSVLTNMSEDPETNQTTGLTDEEVTWFYHDLQEATDYSIRYYGVEGYDRQIFNIFSFLSDKSIIMINGIADDFIEIEYVGYTVDSQGNKVQDRTWGAEEIINMDINERRYIVITRTNQIYKDPYFETMFYKTYIGPPKENEDGTKIENDWQVPCVDMKHFYAEYISSLLEYPYFNTRKGAVVIAKYYEGAFLNGTVTFLGDPVDAKLVVQKNLTYFEGLSLPIEHDKTTTSNGNFSLIAGAGAELQIRRNYPNDVRPFPIKNITFKGEDKSSFAPITDEDAMRRGNNYERFLNISIDPATSKGYIYIDNNDNGEYDSSTDEIVKDAKISIYSITNALTPEKMINAGDNGLFNATNILPGFYLIRAEKDGFVIKDQLVDLYELTNYNNISRYKDSSLEGKVFFGEEDNTISGADVRLTYIRSDPAGNTQERIFIGSTTTGSDGRYSYANNLVPGEYEINVSKGTDYQKVEQISIQENLTFSYNVSLQYTPVNLEGRASYNSAGVEDIEITFEVDESVENNTAVQNTVTTTENGDYSIDLIPGTYNISVENKEGQILVYSYTNNNFNVPIGQNNMNLDILLTKNSVTVNGHTKHLGTIIENVTGIDFEPSGIENNTAEHGKVVSSDANGFFTLELSPGKYVIDVNYTTKNNGQNITYTFSGNLVLINSQIPTGKEYEIALTTKD